MTTESLKLRGTLRGHNGWVTQIATNPKFPDMILSASRGNTSLAKNRWIWVWQCTHSYRQCISCVNNLYQCDEENVSFEAHDSIELSHWAYCNVFSNLCHVACPILLIFYIFCQQIRPLSSGNSLVKRTTTVFPRSVCMATLTSSLTLFCPRTVTSPCLDHGTRLCACGISPLESPPAASKTTPRLFCKLFFLNFFYFEWRGYEPHGSNCR